MSYYDSRQQGGTSWPSATSGITGSGGGGAGGYYGSAGAGASGSGSYGGYGQAPHGGAGGGARYDGGTSGGFGNSTLGAGLKQLDFSAVELVPFEKDFYIEHPTVSVRPESEAAIWRASKQIVVVGQGVPKPVLTFEEASMPQYILSEVLKQGFDRPTAIQSQGWPMALKGKNMVGISATGSGKTLAFLLPAMIHINAQNRGGVMHMNSKEGRMIASEFQILQDGQYLKPGEGPIVLILAPTRELAVQIKEECDKFGGSSDVKNTVVYGGVPKSRQVRDLRSGIEIVIATPGRLIDHLEQGNTNLKRVTYLVLDEADRMLDMGFEPQLRRIVSQIRPDRQVLMWSATWPKDVQNLARDYLHEFYQVTVGSLDLTGNKDVTQLIEVCKDEEKYKKLLQHLRETLTPKDRVLVFVETKKGCDMLTRSLRIDGFQSRSMHGDKTQQERDLALREFKECLSPLLVATDVAARGLDVDDIRMVVNFDFAKNMEDYVHRIGRTGRAGRKGTAVSFFVPAKDGRIARELIEILERTNQFVPGELRTMQSFSFKGGKGNRSRF